MQRDLAHLLDIIQAAERAISYTADRSLDDFASDDLLQDAVMRRLEIIGEAARRVSDSTRDSLAQVPWRQMIGLRNILVHKYEDIDLDVVWDTIKRDLPRLIESLKPLVPPEDQFRE